MKIAFIAPVNGIAGGLYVVYYHANYLHSLGHDVTIIFVSDMMGIKIKSMECAAKTVRLEDVVNAAESFDVLIATWWETYYAMFQIPASCYMYFCQSDERKFYPSKMSFEVPFVEKTYLNKNVGIITISKWIVNWFKEDYGIEAEYAPNGIDLNLFNPDVSPLETKKDKVRILIEGAGRLSFKNIDRTFRITNRFSNIEVWYVSSDGYAKSDWLFQRMFSHLSYSVMPSIYASCDILLKLPSFEGFGLPPLEMMACGGTAVVSKIPGHEEYVEHEKNAILVNIDDEEGAYIALKRLIEDKELRAKLSQNGIQTAKKLDWKYRLPMFFSAIEKLKSKKLHVTMIEKNIYSQINQIIKLKKTQVQISNLGFFKLVMDTVIRLKRVGKFLKNNAISKKFLSHISRKSPL